MAQREPLSTARLIAAAASVADRGGLSAVSMRNVGAELGVEAMSLYHHVANKAALLDGLADWVPQLQLQPVAGASHWLVHEQPTVLTRALELFLQSN